MRGLWELSSSLSSHRLLLIPLHHKLIMCTFTRPPGAACFVHAASATDKHKLVSSELVTLIKIFKSCQTEHKFGTGARRVGPPRWHLMSQYPQRLQASRSRRRKGLRRDLRLWQLYLLTHKVDWQGSGEPDASFVAEANRGQKGTRQQSINNFHV